MALALLLALQLGQLTTAASVGLDRGSVVAQEAAVSAASVGRGSVAGANASIALGARRFPIDRETAITVSSSTHKLPPAPLYLRISRRDTKSGCYAGRSMSPGDEGYACYANWALHLPPIGDNYVSRRTAQLCSSQC